MTLLNYPLKVVVVLLLNAIEEFIKNKAQALIVLTDGYFNGRRLTDPKRPVVWVIYDNESFIPRLVKLFILIYLSK